MKRQSQLSTFEERNNGPFEIKISKNPVTMQDFRIRPEHCGSDTIEQGPNAEDPDVNKIILEYATAMADTNRRKRKATEERLAKSQAIFKEAPSKKHKVDDTRFQAHNNGPTYHQNNEPTYTQNNDSTYAAQEYPVNEHVEPSDYTRDEIDEAFDEDEFEDDATLATEAASTTANPDNMQT